MYVYEFYIEHPMNYVMTGKFEAPSPNWVHEDFPLTDYELFVVTKDTLYISYNGEPFTINEGEFLLLPPLPPPNNRRKGIRPSHCSFYWLHFSVNHEVALSTIPNSKHAAYPYTVPQYTIAIPRQGKIPHAEKIVVLMKQLQDSIRSNYDSTTANYLSTTILCELYSQFYRENNVSQRSKRTQKQMYYDIIDYVKSNTDKNLKVADVAAHFCYNEKYLSHLFSNIAGIPLKQFILNVKMDAANFMLTDTNASISEIAASLGFTDSHNFAKAYKKIAGLTPTEYRNAFFKRLLYHV
jgi:AraC family transcriptional regulator of arabinose operon